MSVFTEAELEFLQDGERRLARIATVGPEGTPHVVPSGWRYDPDEDTIDLGGANLTATKKYRDVARTGRAALVIDEVLAPWRPRGIEVRGRAEAIEAGPIIRLHPERVVSWGLATEGHVRDARSVG